jgi:hypothetical protein
MKELHEYGTPETDSLAWEYIAKMEAVEGDMNATGVVVAEVGKAMIAKASSLEKRLAMARDALSEIVRLGEAMPEPSEECEIAILALKGTEAK